MRSQRHKDRQWQPLLKLVLEHPREVSVSVSKYYLLGNRMRVGLAIEQLSLGSYAPSLCCLTVSDRIEAFPRSEARSNYE